MIRIDNRLLTDTLNFVALAREVARVQGDQGKAERLTPIENSLRNLVISPQDKAVNRIVVQDDFQALLTAVQNVSVEQTSSDTYLARNKIVGAMKAGGMLDVDIAKQMGISREEVQLSVRIAQFKNSSNEVSK